MVNTIVNGINNLVENINNYLYTYVLIILLIAGGLYFTIRTKAVQFALFKEQLRALTDKPDKKGGVSSFQALMVSTASRVGTGNIIGVSTALCLGGFGSVFWMWVIAIIGCASAFVESTLAQIYKKHGKSGSYGGPAYYIEAVCNGKRGLAIIFSVFLILTYGVGFNMLASYNLQSTFSTYNFYNPQYTQWIIGFVIAVIVGYCLFGGGKRVIKVTSFLVPIMGTIYILVAIAVSFINIRVLPSVFSRIFTEAFDIKAIFGGFGGSCIMYGIKRGLFSNEAGVGSAPNASASAEVTHPVKQGLVQILSVFIDTVLVCSATAFMCMTSGVEPTTDLSGAPYIQMSMQSSLGTFGPIFITVSMMLFAFTTLLGNLFYVDKAIAYINKGMPGKIVMRIYYVIASLLIFAGAGLSADLLWNIADVTMGGMTLINIPIIIILGKYAFRALDDYRRKCAKGEDLVFSVKDIGLPHKVDYWE